ncbi:uncharacterized protein LOC128227854 isoform X1 [Mya arenaria]|uniref:uncharacterized protein LOC128227854 isoform X1 n=1 Tax=Mya arenaria TaxID=6604 RepID=UPI0022E55D1E|nr:uncharacterized protein LOC128227854 isoform X1 [Mya arenaria]
MPADSGGHQSAVILTQDKGVNTDRNFKEEVKRKIRLLRDTSVKFTLFCQERESVISTLFSKLKETGRGHKEEDVNILKEHVREYAFRCTFESGKLFVLKEAVLNITEEYTYQGKVAPKFVKVLKEELQKLMQMIENKSERHESYSQTLKDHDRKTSNRFYVDMLEEDISVMRTEAKEFHEYCDEKYSKIKSHLQAVLKPEQQGGFTDECLKEHATAMKMLTHASKSYFRKICSVKETIRILEKHCHRAKRNTTECSEVVMTFETELGLLKEMHRKRFEEFENNDKEITQKELSRQKSFIDEIDRLKKQLRSSCEQQTKVRKQLKETEAIVDDFAKQLDDNKSYGHSAFSSRI